MSDGVWVLGPPGSGRSHRLRALAADWPGPVVWLRGSALAGDLAAVAGLSAAVLRCVDDLPAGTDRARFGEVSVIAAGARPGEGWTVEPVPVLSEDDGVALFLQHAPGAGPLPLVRALVARLTESPVAVVAAARRWPLQRVEQILVEPTPAWSGLADAYAALTEDEQDALALLARLDGPARWEGLSWCGVTRGVEGLLAAGWIRLAEPGVVTMPGGLAEAVRPWRQGRAAPYFTWFLRSARARAVAWDDEGGARGWFRCGLWPALWAWERENEPAPWFLVAWSLSGEDTAALLAALAESRGLSPIQKARCAARAHHAAGERSQAIAVLQAARPEAAETAAEALLLLELGVAHHRVRQLDASFSAYAEALKHLERLGHTRGSMLCRANLAALAHDIGDRERARAGYAQAITEATELGDARLRGMFRGNLGALHIELGDLAQARALLHQAARELSAVRDDRFLAIVTVNWAAVDLLEGHLDAADAHYQEALTRFSSAAPSSIALCHARRGAVAALRGDLDAARRHHEQADARLSPLEDPFTAKLLELWRVFVEWQAGDRASALTRRRDSLTGTPSLVETSDEARLVLRLLEQLAARPGETVIVGARGVWFRLPGSEQVSVEKYAAVTRILATLALRAETEPGTSSSAAELVAAGWPGERIMPDAARNRLSVALARLRKMGLRKVLQNTRSGWRLDPAWPVLLLREDEPATIKSD